MKRASFILILISFMLLTSSFADAEPVAWHNAAGGIWSSAANWTPVKVPVPVDDVVISVAGLITVDSDVTINLLTFEAGAGTLTLNTGAFMTIAGDFIYDPYTLLCWDKKDSATTMNWTAAGSYCFAKGARLPTIGELVYFATAGEVSFTGQVVFLYGFYTDLRPSLLARGYEYNGIGGADYWSSDNGPDNYATNYAWDVIFYDGYVNFYIKTNNNSVRCVRAGQ